MPTQLPKDERALRASIAAHHAHAKHGTAKMTANMRDAANFTCFADEIDPERQLPTDELAKRVEHLRKAHMKAISFEAAKARRRKAEQRKAAVIEEAP
jgi:hypothetical protein